MLTRCAGSVALTRKPRNEQPLKSCVMGIIASELPSNSLAYLPSLKANQDCNAGYVCAFWLDLRLLTLILLSKAAVIMNRKDRKPTFPKVRPHAPNTMQTPSRSGLTLRGRINQSLWAFGARMRQSDIKYAFKAGMGMAILAAPAFFDRTRPTFMHYRGEWALISVCPMSAHSRAVS